MKATTWKSLPKLGTNHMLATIGLEKRRDPISDVLLPSLALFAAGAALGAATTALLTPKSGPVLRREIADGARGLTRRLTAREVRPTRAQLSESNLERKQIES